MNKEDLPNDETNPRKHAKGAHLCNAKSDTCKLIAVKGFTKCRRHGGATPTGIASTHFKHGERSRVLPQHLAKRFKRAMADPKLLELNEEVATVAALIEHRLASFEEKHSGEVWEALEKAVADFEAAQKAGSADRMESLLNQILSAVKSGASEYSKEKDYLRLVETRRRVTESQRRRQAEAEMVLSLSEATSMFTAILQVVRNETKHDSATLRRIQQGISRLNIGLESGH